MIPLLAFGSFSIASLLISVLLGGGMSGFAWVVGFLAYHNVAGPLRRHERARCLLHLLETGSRQGKTYEQTIVSLAASGDRTLEPGLQKLAMAIQSGLSLGAALQTVPRFLPVPIAPMLRVGEETGTRAALLPAMKGSLKDSGSRALASQNYTFAGLFPIPLLGALIGGTLAVWVVPKFLEITKEMVETVPPNLVPMIQISQVLALVSAAISMLIFLSQGLIPERLESSATPQNTIPLAHRFAHALPWRRSRLRRDMAATLAILLDSGVPEEQALLLAGRATGNRCIINKTERAAHHLRQGVALVEALRQFDDNGEYAWRLKNAAAGCLGFTAALAGWLEHLEAKAFQQEQTAAHIISTSCILLNSAMAALLICSIFKPLIAVMEGALLW